MTNGLRYLREDIRGNKIHLGVVSNTRAFLVSSHNLAMDYIVSSRDVVVFFSAVRLG